MRMTEFFQLGDRNLPLILGVNCHKDDRKTTYPKRRDGAKSPHESRAFNSTVDTHIDTDVACVFRAIALLKVSDWHWAGI